MKRNLHRFPIVSIAALSLAVGQGVNAPTVSEPTGKLAAEATLKLHTWVEYRPGLMRDLFRMRPDEAVAALQTAAQYMGDYKDAQIALYDGLIGLISRDTELLRATAPENWKRYREDREGAYGRDIASLLQQKSEIERQISELNKVPGESSLRLKALLNDQLDNVRNLLDTTVKLRSAFEQPRSDDPDKSRGEVLGSLEEQEKLIQHLKALEQDDRQSMEKFYSYLQAAVKPNPRPPPTQAVPKAAPSKVGPSPEPTIPNASTRQNDLPLQRTASWVRNGPGGNTTPKRIVFTVKERRDMALDAVYQVWFNSDTGGPPDLALDCSCLIESNYIDCSSASRNWEGKLTLTSRLPITNSMPNQLWVAKIEGNWNRRPLPTLDVNQVPLEWVDSGAMPESPKSKR